jgi:hypothetical protein
MGAYLLLPVHNNERCPHVHALSLQANVVRLWWTPADGAPLQPGHADGNTEFIQGYVESGMIDALQKAGDAEL